MFFYNVSLVYITSCCHGSRSSNCATSVLLFSGARWSCLSTPTSTLALSHFLIQFLSTTPAPKKKLKILSSPTLRTICSHCKTLLISYSLVFMFSLVPNPLVTLHNLVSLYKTLSCVSLQPPKESRLFPVLVVSRVVFIPLLMLCNVQSRSFLPVYFAHDGAFTAIMALFSLSSGYFVCLSMSYAPQ